jgi:2-hydroxychromene-2-carboxylate isomerase
MTENCPATLEFWFELASNYSYLAAMRIEPLAEAARVEVRWRPFLLGPIFRSQGWETSPFSIYKAKGTYMWRDMERLAQVQGLTFVKPDPFPQNSLHSARAALTTVVGSRIGEFSRSVFHTEFSLGQDISDPEVLGGVARDLGLDGPAMLREANSASVKEKLRSDTAEAQERGIFGAPSFITPDGELFWGNDRLEQAIEWAAGQRRTATPRGSPALRTANSPRTRARNK